MKKWILGIVIALAFAIQMLVAMPSGSHYCQNNICGLYFWGAHEHDGIWHLALINSALSTWPAKFPTFSGAMLSGYNALLDIILRGINDVTRIPAMTLYFKVVPLLWFAAMIWVWTKFAKIYKNTKWFTIVLLFFVFFGNSLSYLFRLFHAGTIWGASGILSMQSPQMLNNIQYALTLPLLGLMLIIFKKNKLGWREILGLGCLNFLMMGLKFYGGIVAIVMACVFALTLVFQKQWKLGVFAGIVSAIGFGLATLIFYNPLANLGSSPILLFKPLVTVHPIIEEIGLFFAPSIANLRNNLYASGGGIRLILIEMVTLAIFILFNWGTRIIGLWGIARKPFDYILLSGIVTGLLMNILFIQRGEWWNTVQFLYYAIFLSNIYASKVLSQMIESGNKIWIAGATVIVLLTIPNAIDTYRIFSSYPPQSYVSDTELQALRYLKDQPKGIVLALPIEAIAGNAQQLPRPLYNRYDTAYVAAFSGKQTYLNDLVQLRLTGIEYHDRLEQVNSNNCNILQTVNYLYVAGDNTQASPWQKCDKYKLSEIYNNNEATIFAVSPR